MACPLCNRPLEAGSNNNYNHDICLADEDSRIKNGKCHACGKNPIDYNGRCTSCLKDEVNGVLKLQDYLGPR